MMGHSGYSAKTLLGNYSEDIQLEENKIREYLKGKRTGSGSAGRVGKLRKHLEPYFLTPRNDDGNVHFGDVVMLQNAATDAFLSTDLDDKLGPTKFGVSAAHAKGPMQRNSFRIVKATDNKLNKRTEAQFVSLKEGEVLHYNQKFYLINDALNPDGKMYLHSEAYTAMVQSRVTKRQQVCLSMIPSWDVCWEVLPVEVSKRTALDGKPVPANTAVVFSHCPTSQYLSAEKGKAITTTFGAEAEVCCWRQSHTSAKFMNIQETVPCNMWAFVTAPTGAHYDEQQDAAFGDTAATLNRVKNKLLQRAGTGGYRSLIRVLKILDDDGDRKLDSAELKDGLMTYGVYLDDQEVKAVMRSFDRDGSGKVSITEFLRGLRGEMNQRRVAIVLEAYKRLDRNGDETVNLKDLNIAYGKNIHRHPDVVSGQKTKNQALLEFSTAWDKNEDGTVTKPEFIDYYTDLSVNIDHDDYFELMVRNAWHISGGEGWSENTTCRRVLVVHTDGSQTVEEVKDDLGIEAEDLDAIRANLMAQGIRDIKKIQLTG
eukprot:TRINITY_DN103415_c0_g1_i1.p1 TRINITY_DN103415_c0_g1~~TRINITY_DN103415_c0_g1_i1.p1  ORF type:complete len:564 (-),score=63.52 TRINITY_DN103415_c0_g1_i1:59-1675(-)